MQPSWDETRNREVYGRAFGPHGHEYKVEVAWAGLVSREDGMIVNLVDVKPLLLDAIAPWEDCFLNDLPAFSDVVPTAENVALRLWQTLPDAIANATLYRLKLQQSRQTRVEIQSSDNQSESPRHSMKIARSYEFAAAHRLALPSLSDAENQARFDKCSNLAGHGHNFQLDVWVEGTPDPNSGFIILPQILDQLVQEEVYARFDHKHLNEDCPEFAAHQNLVPTSENLARVIFRLLHQRLANQGHQLARIGLRETQKNYFEVESDTL